MLQAMQKKVTAEAAKEQELYDKFMCYCKNGGGELSKSIGDADTKIPQLGSDIKEAEAKNAQLKEDLKQHQDPSAWLRHQGGRGQERTVEGGLEAAPRSLSLAPTSRRPRPRTHS